MECQDILFQEVRPRLHLFRLFRLFRLPAGVRRLRWFRSSCQHGPVTMRPTALRASTLKENPCERLSWKTKIERHHAQERPRIRLPRCRW